MTYGMVFKLWLHLKTVDDLFNKPKKCTQFLCHHGSIRKSLILSYIFFKDFPYRGAEPKPLAFSAALGITVGVFPVCGVTVFLCGLAIALLGTICHAPTIMLANFVATPVEISLVGPFLRFGEVISGGNHFPLSSDALKKVLTGQASWEILLSIFHALLRWLVASPFVFGVLCLFFLPLLKYMVYKFGVISSSPSRLSQGHSVHSHPEIKVKVRTV